MGTAAWKHKVDMYLYYELGSWSPFFSVGGYRPMGQPDGVTPTLEVLDMRYASASYDGEAMLILPGPEGMLSTLHFDSLRDGLEDFEYYHLLSELVQAAEKKGVDAHKEAAML